MRRITTVLTCLVLTGLLVISAPTRPALGNASSPQDPLVTYFETIVLPAVKGQSVTDEALKMFYSEDLLPSTHVQVAEDQFVGYWRNTAKAQGPGPAYTSNADYALSEPVYNEANDEVLITSDLTLSMAQKPTFTILTVFVAIGCVASGAYCAPMAIGGKRLADTVTTYRVIKLRGVWRLELPPDVVADMRKIPTMVTATRYAPNASTTEGGLTLWASEVALDRVSHKGRVGTVGLIDAGRFGNDCLCS